LKLLFIENPKHRFVKISDHASDAKATYHERVSIVDVTHPAAPFGCTDGDPRGACRVGCGGRDDDDVPEEKPEIQSID
jgi:hypothetical protein